MKQYLNNKARNNLYMLASFKSFMDDLVAEWTQHNAPKDNIADAKRVATYTNKIMVRILGQAHPDEVTKMIGIPHPRIPGQYIKKGELQKMQLILKYKDSAVKEFEDLKKLDDVTPIKTRQLLDLIGFALASCELCEMTGCDVESCDMRKLFLEYDAELLNPDAKEGECPYRLPRKVIHLKKGAK